MNATAAALLKGEMENAIELATSGRDADAIGALSRIVEAYPDTPETKDCYPILCDLSVKTGVRSIPKAWISNAVRYDRTFVKTFIDYSSRLFSENHVSDAAHILASLLEDNPSDHEIWNDLGVIMFSMKDYGNSERFLSKAIALKNDYAEAKANLAALHAACAGEGIDISAGERAKEFRPDLDRKSVIWYSTMKCNNRCPYCLAFQVDDPMTKVPFRSYRDWVEVWNRFEGDLLLDITGGEPFLLPDFTTMIEELNGNIKVAVTTNTRLDISRFVQTISPEKCISITASLHPSTSMNVEHFIGKVLLLKNRGFCVTVNYVAYPEQLWLIPYFKRMVENIGVRFHVDPYGPGPKRPFVLSEKEEMFLRQYVGADRSDFFSKEPTLYKCSGGMNLFSVLPNGDAYTCVTKRYVKENFVGNVFDAGFRPFADPIRCEAISCAGCDTDKVSRIPWNAEREP